MSSFRDRMIHWVEKAGVKAQQDGAVRRHQAIIEDQLHLIIQHDPLSPAGDALAAIQLIPLPYNTNQRQTALAAMLSLNHKILASESFALTLSEDGEYISLVCRAAASDMTEAEFRRIMARFFGWAKYARSKLAPAEHKNAMPSDLSVRYL